MEMESGGMIMRESKFQDQLEALYEALAGTGRTSDCATIIEDESRRFLKQAIAFTPPKTRAQGEQAIRDDLNRVFTPVKEDFYLYVSSEFGNSGVQQWLTNKAGQKYKIDWQEMAVIPQRIDAIHQQQRNNRGRTIGFKNRGSKEGSLWRATFVTTYDVLADQIKKTIAKVGMMKSGWVKSYKQVGGEVPSWIERHLFRNTGSFIDNLARPGAPAFTMINRAPGIRDQERILTETLRARTQAIKKRIKMVVAGYAGDIRRGQRVRKKATATND